MKVFIDTNVLLDYLNHRDPFFDDATTIVGLCGERRLEGVISSLTIVNCMYIARKMYTRENLFDQLDWMLNVFTIFPIDKATIRLAAALRPADFEDAVQHYSALQQDATYVITRDKSGFKDFSIPFAC